MFRDGQRRHQPDVLTAIWHLSLVRFLVCLFFTHKDARYVRFGGRLPYAV